jgi:hypothetical protein
VLLASIESGEMTVDQADECARVFGGAKSMALERTRLNLENDPVRDQKTPVAYKAVLKEVPREARGARQSSLPNSLLGKDLRSIPPRPRRLACRVEM